MADEMKHAAEAIREHAKTTADTMKASAERMAESGSALSLKLIEQAELNMKEAFAAIRAAASARDVSDVMQIQGDFLRAQGSRTIDQAREIGEMITEFGRDAVGKMTHRP